MGNLIVVLGGLEVIALGDWKESDIYKHLSCMVPSSLGTVLHYTATFLRGSQEGAHPLRPQVDRFWESSRVWRALAQQLAQRIEMWWSAVMGMQTYGREAKEAGFTECSTAGIPSNLERTCWTLESPEEESNCPALCLTSLQLKYFLLHFKARMPALNQSTQWT